MLRIHFSTDDLARVRVAERPDPMWEMLLSVHMLRQPTGALTFGRWRDQVRRSMVPFVRPLFHLAPPTGYSPDFLTPEGGDKGLLPGIDAVLSTPKDRLRGDMEQLAADRPLPTWAGSLAEGELGTLNMLGHALKGYHQLALAPYWGPIRTALEADRMRRARTFVSGGVEQLLTQLHPSLTWESPTLTMRYIFGDRDLYLDGRGLLLVPSFFCWDYPIMLRDPGRTPVLVYPIEHRVDWMNTEASPRSLVALLGRTRAAALEAISTGCTTGELARRIGVSPASASDHATVLREAGLTTSRRHRNTVFHTVSALGIDLLNGGFGEESDGLLPGRANG